jgi:hypothetical protein
MNSITHLVPSLPELDNLGDPTMRRCSSCLTFFFSYQTATSNVQKVAHYLQILWEYQACHSLPFWSFMDRLQMAGDVTMLNVEFHRTLPDGRRRHYTEFCLTEVQMIYIYIYIYNRY